jgi:hypothetical protein
MNYYVYIYLNKNKPGEYSYDDVSFDYEPFYVGKGKGKRYLYHLNKVRNNSKYKSNLKFRIIEENIKFGLEPIIIRYDNLTEEQSLILEKSLIKKIGRIDIKCGPLTNRNDGGLKPQDNYHHDEESKNKISISGKNRNAEERYTLISPDGLKYENIKLNVFCNDNNLDYQKMRKSSNKGIISIRSTSIKQSKSKTINCIGWEVINKKLFKQIKKDVKYKLIDPIGNETLIYSGDMIKNVCEKFNLDQRTLRYYKNKGIIKIKNKNQCSNRSINCQGWQFIDLGIPHQHF